MAGSNKAGRIIGGANCRLLIRHRIALGKVITRNTEKEMEAYVYSQPWLVLGALGESRLM